MKNGKNECCGIVPLEHEISECADPAEIARKVKLAFRKMPGEMALAGFAKIMTADLPHNIKVGVWDAVRYSHIWWGVDDVLKGSVMENPVVQQAFADAVPMRRWLIANQRPGSYVLDTATEPAEWEDRRIYHTCCYTNAQRLVGVIVKGEDSETADYIRVRKGILNKGHLDYTVADFVDYRGNSILCTSHTVTISKRREVLLVRASNANCCAWGQTPIVVTTSAFAGMM